MPPMKQISIISTFIGPSFRRIASLRPPARQTPGQIAARGAHSIRLTSLAADRSLNMGPASFCTDRVASTLFTDRSDLLIVDI